MNKVFLYGPTVVFIAALFLVQISGNDKAAFIILGALALDIVCAIAVLVAGITAKQKGLTLLTHFIVVLIPVLYTLLVITLARCCGLDTMIFLGFR